MTPWEGGKETERGTDEGKSARREAQRSDAKSGDAERGVSRGAIIVEEVCEVSQREQTKGKRVKKEAGGRRKESNRKQRRDERDVVEGRAARTLNVLRRDAQCLVEKRKGKGATRNKARRWENYTSKARGDETKEQNATAVLCAGFYPNVLRVRHPAATYIKTEGGAVLKEGKSKEVKLYARDVGRVFLHPSSVNFNVGRFESGWLIYSERVQTAKVYVRECTMVPPYALLLFGGDIEVLHADGQVTVDRWVRFQAPARIAVLVRELRAEVDKLLVEKIRVPQLDLSAAPTLEAMLKLLATDGY
ncbi:hypothetical protein CYMTET_38381 [Cymbomonas tetramitiformis]|uniref:DEAD-box helicase OB fold domain-containing protein n=1 Tax=Cymbomonas tetramitiformis TaxID=36881 RepID=A0AAE0CC48_9CHLO|nr:hypothetical protein CYMTET_38381 [Cymbomonas tetramitiformis]